ncbi:MAG: hypothetical protein ACSHWY_05395, partial [Octadecabacter sp.]
MSDKKENKTMTDTAETTSAPLPIRRVAICGEIRSGKSSQLNALLCETFLHDNLGNDDRPTVYVEYDDEKDIQYFTANGESITPEKLKSTTPPPKIENIQISHDREELSNFEFIEIPLTNAESLTDKQVRLLESCDIMIWVTIASQAWRLTEKTIIDEFGAAVPKHCILSVSRSDKLRTLADKDKLSDRLTRETSDIFGEIVFVKNARQKIALSAKSELEHRKTGADEILDALNAMSEQISLEPVAPEPTVEAEPEVQADTAIDDTATADPKPASKDDIGSVLKPQVDDIGQDIVVGLHQTSKNDAITVIKGNADFGQNVADTCRKLQSTWLDAGGRGLEDASGFSIAVRTKTHSLLYQNATEESALFMFSDIAQQTHGVAQNKLNQMCKTLGA